MMDPRPVERSMLVGVVDLSTTNDGLDFGSAKQMAEQVASEKLVDPFLLAWFDRKAWKHSPPVC